MGTMLKANGPHPMSLVMEMVNQGDVEAVEEDLMITAEVEAEAVVEVVADGTKSTAGSVMICFKEFNYFTYEGLLSAARDLKESPSNPTSVEVNSLKARAFGLFPEEECRSFLLISNNHWLIQVRNTMCPAMIESIESS